MRNKSSIAIGQITSGILVVCCGMNAVLAAQTYSVMPKPIIPQKTVPQPLLGPQDIYSIPAVTALPKTQESLNKELSLEDAGEKLFHQKEFDQALIKWQEAYGMSLEMSYGEGQGRNLVNMSRVYMEQSKPAKAKELAENAIEILSVLSDKKSLGQARVALAQAYLALDNPMWAGQQLELAMKDFSNLGSNDAPEAAKVMEMVGSLLIKLSKVKEAVQFYQGSALYSAYAGDFIRCVTTRNALAGIMQEMGWLQAALEESKKSLGDARLSKNPNLIAGALSCVGGCQYNLGEFAAARQSYEEALSTQTKNLSEFSKANMYVGYGHVLGACGDLESAKNYLSKALTVMSKAGTIVIQVQENNSLGVIEEILGNHREAIQYLSQANDMRVLANPQQERLGIVVLQNLATAEAHQGDRRNARAHFESALSLSKKIQDAVLEGRTLTSLAEVLLNQRNVEQSADYLKQGIAISEKVSDDSALWRDYTILARIQQINQQPDLARASLTSALSYFRSPQSGVFPSIERLAFVSTREDMGYWLASYLVSEKMIEPALLVAEQLKEEAFINEWTRNGGQVKPEDKDIYNDLVQERAHLHTAEISATPDKLVKDWKSWLIRFQQLATDSSPLARLIAPVPTTIHQIIKIAEINQVSIIDYLVGPDNSLLFTVNQSGNVNAFNLPVGRLHLQMQVSSLLNSEAKPSAGSHQDNQGTLQMLYNELLPPETQTQLPASPDDTLVVVPDGVLFNLPFAALLNSLGKYLIEDHTLTISPSLGMFLDSSPQVAQKTNKTMVLTSVPPSGTKAERALLASANQESKQIASLFQPEQVTQLIDGQDREVSNFQEQARGKSILHFSTTTQLPSNNPFSLYIPLLINKTKQKATADSLFSLNLPSSLVVWSATAVNTKDVQGNAIQIFAHGLGYAGVRNVIMSLWVEPDAERTSELIAFYKGNQVGLNEAQALRKAEMLAIAKDPSPHSWAAFQLLGPGN